MGNFIGTNFESKYSLNIWKGTYDKGVRIYKLTGVRYKRFLDHESYFK